ncbi:3-methyladenine DNA glycosylase [Williamsia sterculiae]|uniref:3-methyladenine DNA glycosylase n=1 Tax=Williamsia sterculiae TaxID=1344003 RepID=A0A1N7H313_9NOCA|nr:3-methyladenine DNA glycosylase [Williamsia sterculiae]SIS19150.1 hypothetical protein SAMN05445060_3439 [Williamsia sterculiae]
MTTGASITLPAEVWRPREQAHGDRIDELLTSHPPRGADGTPHPVWSFLFTYYNHKPSALRRWHPGFGVILDDAPDHARRPGYRALTDGVGRPAATVDHGQLHKRIDTARFVHRLLTATAARAPRLNCFGLHEWAMVYRTDRTRHPVPMRLSAADTDAVVESSQLRCTHIDAFRFFTEPAAPRNQTRPMRESQVADEQPGCVHAGMDLYKWAFKLSPLVVSDLVCDAFALALDFRHLDMRASPYDLTDHGLAPVPVETPSGRADYVREQTALADRAAAVRRRLIEATAALIDAHDRADP